MTIYILLPCTISALHKEDTYSVHIFDHQDPGGKGKNGEHRQ